MMLDQTPRYPGVYIKEVPSGVRPVTGASTATVAFVGATFAAQDKGWPEELRGKARLVASLSDVHAMWPQEDAQGGGKPKSPAQVAARDGGELYRAMVRFYENGGGRAYVCPVGAQHPATVEEFRAMFDETLARVADVSIVVLPGVLHPEPLADQQDGNAAAGGGGDAEEDDEGDDGAEVDDGGGDRAAIIAAATQHCTEMGDRMLIVDLPEEPDLQALKNANNLPKSPYVATYFPWLREPGGEQGASVPPSAFAAAIWGRTDARRGVWKAPAGMEARLVGVDGVDTPLKQVDGAELNDKGINTIRTVAGHGTVLWGARTRADLTTDADWKYIPVRRTAQMIERSIFDSIQWAVFEPNDHRLWSGLKVNIAAFMDDLFRAGAFQGETASSAYFVRCGLGSTMTQTDIDAGRVIVDVGFAPLKPAEFVIVRVQQIVNQARG